MKNEEKESKNRKLFCSSTCVICGKYVPEGTIVCSVCNSEETTDYFSSSEFLEELKTKKRKGPKE